MLAGRFPRRCLSRFAACASIAQDGPTSQPASHRGRAFRGGHVGPSGQPDHASSRTTLWVCKSDSDPSLYYLRVTICGGG